MSHMQKWFFHVLLISTSFALMWLITLCFPSSGSPILQFCISVMNMSDKWECVCPGARGGGEYFNLIVFLQLWKLALVALMDMSAKMRASYEAAWECLYWHFFNWCFIEEPLEQDFPLVQIMNNWNSRITTMPSLPLLLMLCQHFDYKRSFWWFNNSAIKKSFHVVN